MPTTGSRRPRRALASMLAVAAVGTGMLTACSDHTTPLSSRAQRVQSTDSNVSYKKCGDQCEGTINGAAYTIKMPQKWNGTLLLYSHGYRFATVPAAEPTSPIQTNAQVTSTDSDGKGTDPLSQDLLAQGYALAGSAYKSNGWAVADGVTAGEQLRDKFVSLVGNPRRTYVWGDSLGGLITEILAETNPKWVDGAAPMCGAVAGPNLNFDTALDVAFAVKTLIDPSFVMTNYTSADQANQEWTEASAAIQKAAADTAGGGTAKVLYIASLVNAPDKTTTYDGHDLTSEVKAQVESVLTALAFGTSGRYELEQRVGGNPSQNTDVDYSKRISSAEASTIAFAGGDVAKLDQALADAPRVQADKAARDKFEALGDTTGDISKPTVTMHTEDDPLVLVSNEAILAQRALAKGDSGHLVQMYIAPPATYSETTGAPYGAGHCNFSDQQREGLIKTLNAWVTKGVYPTPAGSAPAFGPGLDPSFVPLPWPQAGVE